MSKRIEEQAVKWYDSVKYKSDLSGTPISGYIAGYEQAEKDTIERAVNVLVNLPSLVIPSNYIAYFRKKMMEEE